MCYCPLGAEEPKLCRCPELQWTGPRSGCGRCPTTASATRWWTPHQRALGELHFRLTEYVRATGIGEVFFSPSDLEFDPRTLVQPDLFVVPFNEGRRIRNWSEIQRLLLAVEILSPSTARYDRLTKRRVYQRESVEYWIIDIDARVVERWRPGDERPEILAERLEWQPDKARAAWVLELEGYFDAVWGTS